MKQQVKLLFKTLISNAACVEAGRTKSIGFTITAIAFGLVSLFLSVLPVSISNFQTAGSAWVSSSVTYNVDLGIYNFNTDAKNKGLTFIVKKDGSNKSYLEVDQAKWNETYKNDDAKYPGYVNLPHYTFEGKLQDETNNVKLFEVFVNTELNDKDLANYITNIANNVNPTVQSETKEDAFMDWTIKEGTTEKVKISRSTSFMVFGKYSVYGYMYKYGTSSVVGSFGGDYANTKEGTDLLQAYVVDLDPAATLNNWKKFFNDAFVNIRWQSGWRTTGIMVGVNGGVILFMGFMIWILTRGKNNPFRIYTILDCFKIGAFASLTPAILAQLGFLLSSFAMMLFILVIGVRVMWLSMRTLRPASN